MTGIDELKLVEVFRGRNLPEAHVARLALEDHGLRVWVDGEALQGGVGELPAGWRTAPRILVREEDSEQARTVLRKLRRDALSHRSSSSPEDGDAEPGEQSWWPTLLRCFFWLIVAQLVAVVLIAVFG